MNKLKLLWSRGAFHIIIGNFMTKFLVFFGSILLVRSMSKSDFGTLAFIENIYGYIYIFAGLGLANGILRFLVISKDAKEEYAYYRYILKRGSIFNIGLISLAALTIYLITFSSNFEAAKYLLILYFLALPFQFIIDINFFTLRAKLSNKLFAGMTLIFAVIVVYGKFFGAYLYNLEGVIVFSVIINILFAMLIFSIIYRKYFKSIETEYLLQADKLNLNKYSLQYMLTNGIWVLFMLNDIFLLNVFIGDPEILAEYKVAYVLPANLAIFSSAIGVFVAPYFIRNENNKQWVLNKYKTVLGVTASILGFVSLVLGIFAEGIISLLFGREYLNIVEIALSYTQLRAHETTQKIAKSVYWYNS